MPATPAVLLALLLAPAEAGTALETVLERAGAYVTGYAEALRYVVAEEQYRQWYVGHGEAIRSLTLRSDLVFVRLPGPLPWTMFRDVFEVDGRKLRDRDRRLERLFMQSSLRDAGRQADAILQESSRYNLGPSYHTINVPTLALLFLLPENQKRIAFELRKGSRAIAGFVAAEVGFQERSSPTLVHDRWNNDVPARGRFFVDASRGTVLRSEITYDLAPEVRRTGDYAETSFVATEYRREVGLGAFVPAEMTELHDLRGGRVETKARYSNFRRFEVTTEERVGRWDELPPEGGASPPPPSELPMIAAPPLPGELGPLLQRISDYVARYEEAFRNVAATEVCRRSEQRPDGSTFEATARSEVVFAMRPGAVPWTLLREPWSEGRDPGEPSRLERLFGESPGSALREAQALTALPGAPGAEAATPRTEPTLALATLRPDNRDGYRFERRGRGSIDGVLTVEVAFTEVAGRTLVRDTQGHDLPARGRFWAREADGAVLRSEIFFEAPAHPGEGLEAVTEYRLDEGLGILVPAVLRETLRSLPALPTPAIRAPVESTARYERFRRIVVSPSS